MSSDMLPGEFKSQWLTGGESLVCYARESLADLAMNEADRDFLVAAGFPSQAAPVLNFEAISPLPTADKVWELPPKQRNMFYARSLPERGAPETRVALGKCELYDRIATPRALAGLAEPEIGVPPKTCWVTC